MSCFEETRSLGALKSRIFLCSQLECSLVLKTMLIDEHRDFLQEGVTELGEVDVYVVLASPSTSSSSQGDILRLEKRWRGRGWGRYRGGEFKRVRGLRYRRKFGIGFPNFNLNVVDGCPVVIRADGGCNGRCCDRNCCF
ncbi:hypothetical protein PPACK8108_LOCUS9573 [Phakopsora pachyrhizi]|uniref:Uncharacterized protein n=1 Tax=Phakopsora pachyrhizi TaxID=170000 RepID=A0AAV0AZ55_PHAPC|nr:hypothetical protein PPACK8108_LOCUS9573 [Phakopsora pachyrhizi]